MRWIRRGLLALVLLVVLLAAGLYLAVRGSLARYDGETAAGLKAPAVLTRDATGYLNVEAATRLDAARALGYVHAQERFFQMDLLRRNAAGELAALVGAKALPLDQKHRLHRFRARAEATLAAMPEVHRKTLEAYAEGVNAGLAQLKVRPFEYLLLRQTPKPWLAADAMLANYSMYLDLQRSPGTDDIATGLVKSMVPAEWYAFLTQHSADWSAAIDGSLTPAVPVPATPSPFASPNAHHKLACKDCTLRDSRDIGSNNWAVGGALTPHGGAILADDMHLGIRVPGIWFKARLAWRENGIAQQIMGVTLPGTPAMVAGSNGHVAWGFTNSTGDWADAIALKLSADGQRYLTPDGEKAFTILRERIEVAGGAAVEMDVKETIWGPVMAAPFERYALRWVAHDVEGSNMRLLNIEHARTVNEALRLGAGGGIPAQNVLVADKDGHIGWTIAGAMPRKQIADPDVPQDWSDGRNRWQGYLGPDEQPMVIDPADARLWTANNRVVGGEALAKIGNGGYDLGARAQQIRDGLRAKPKLDEADLHALHLDNRALMLQRWKQLLLSEVLTPGFVKAQHLAEYRRHVEQSTESAGPGQVGYTLTRAFRLAVLEQTFAPLAKLLEERRLSIRDFKFVPENPGWALLQARRADTLPAGVASWQALLEGAVLSSRDKLLKEAGSLDKAGWAERNLTQIKHPLSAAVPGLDKLLDMPAAPQSGDSHMPKVSLPVHGQSERMVVAPGREDKGILVIPAGQSGHPLSPFYAADHKAWLAGTPTPFLPGPAIHRLLLTP